MISLQDHKAVVVVDDDKAAYGFTTIAGAVGFIESQSTSARAMINVIDALSEEGVESGVIDANSYKILPVEDYFEIYSDEDDDSE
jgi:hypothetical protein